MATLTPLFIILSAYLVQNEFYIQHPQNVVQTYICFDEYYKNGVKYQSNCSATNVTKEDWFPMTSSKIYEYGEGNDPTRHQI